VYFGVKRLINSVEIWGDDHGAFAKHNLVFNDLEHGLLGFVGQYIQAHARCSIRAFLLGLRRWSFYNGGVGSDANREALS
jgi:hypothetical protein